MAASMPDATSDHHRSSGTSSSPRRRSPYGVDRGFRDPQGNSVRLTQVMEHIGG
ncbi:hypothetical protein [Nostocoides japonicum]|uniref:hypothetical protein n=1 Tax=Nostocoides japonicum TaxID=99481 RepID=UPI0012F8C308|nr:hypothetical protein [Tetrasphaera japonica]